MKPADSSPGGFIHAKLEGHMATDAIPEGYHTVTPYLAVDDAAQAIEYDKKAFGAK